MHCPPGRRLLTLTVVLCFAVLHCVSKPQASMKGKGERHRKKAISGEHPLPDFPPVDSGKITRSTAQFPIGRQTSDSNEVKKDYIHRAPGVTHQGGDKKGKTEDTVRMKDANQFDAKEPEDPQGNSEKSEDSQGDTEKSEDSQGDTEKSEDSQGDTEKSEDSQGDTEKSEDSQGDTEKSEDSQGDTEKSEDSQGDTEKSEDSQGDTEKSEDSQGDTEKSEDSQGDTEKSEDSQGDTEKSEDSRGDTEKSEDSQGDTEKSEDSQGDTEKSEDSQGDTEKSEDSQGDTEKSEDSQGDSEKDENSQGDDGVWGADFLTALEQLVGDTDAFALRFRDNVVNLRQHCVVRGKLVSECEGGIEKIEGAVLKVMDTIRDIRGGVQKRNDFGPRSRNYRDNVGGFSSGNLDHGSGPAVGEFVAPSAGPIGSGDGNTYEDSMPSSNLWSFFFTVLSIAAVSVSGFVWRGLKRLNVGKAEKVGGNKLCNECTEGASPNHGHYPPQAANGPTLLEAEPPVGQARAFPGPVTCTSTLEPPAVERLFAPKVFTLRKTDVEPCGVPLLRPRPQAVPEIEHSVTSCNPPLVRVSSALEPTRQFVGSSSTVSAGEDRLSNPDIIVNTFLQKWS